MDELDEFNEAPHSLRSEANSIHHLPPDDDDDDGDDDDDDDRSRNINILDRTNGRIETRDLISTDLLVGSEYDLVLTTDDLLIDANNHNTVNNISNSFNQFALNNSDQRQLLHQNPYHTNSFMGDGSVAHSQSSDSMTNENVNNWLNHSNSDSDVTIITNNKSIGNNKNSHIA